MKAERNETVFFKALREKSSVQNSISSENTFMNKNEINILSDEGKQKIVSRLVFKRNGQRKILS